MFKGALENIQHKQTQDIDRQTQEIDRQTTHLKELIEIKELVEIMELVEIKKGKG